VGLYDTESQGWHPVATAPTNHHSWPSSRHAPARRPLNLSRGRQKQPGFWKIDRSLPRPSIPRNFALPSLPGPGADRMLNLPRHFQKGVDFQKCYAPSKRLPACRRVLAISRVRTASFAISGSKRVDDEIEAARRQQNVQQRGRWQDVAGYKARRAARKRARALPSIIVSEDLQGIFYYRTRRTRSTQGHEKEKKKRGAVRLRSFDRHRGAATGPPPSGQNVSHCACGAVRFLNARGVGRALFADAPRRNLFGGRRCSSAWLCQCNEQSRRLTIPHGL